METFLEHETMCHETARRYMFVESLAEIDPRKWQKWCIVQVTKKTTPLRPIFSRSL